MRRTRANVRLKTRDIFFTFIWHLLVNSWLLHHTNGDVTPILEDVNQEVNKVTPVFPNEKTSILGRQGWLVSLAGRVH